MGIEVTKSVTSNLRVCAADLAFPVGETPLLRVHCREDTGNGAIDRTDAAAIRFKELSEHPATAILCGLRAEDVGAALEKFLYALLPGVNATVAETAVTAEATARDLALAPKDIVAK